VERGVKIPIELETSYLQIKTNSAVGSGDQTVIEYFDKEGRDAGGIGILFSSPRVWYRLFNCALPTPFPHILPTTVNKLWTIEKRRYRTRVFCNEALVLEFTVSDSTCDTRYWETYWGRKVSKIEFHSVDTASEQYRTGQLLQLF
jgi:hypothetical protein